MQPLTVSDEDRIWALIDQGAIEDCWLWKGSMSVGRGSPQFYSCRVGKHISCRPTVWRSSFPDSKIQKRIYMACHNAQCLNPYHMMDGTPVSIRFWPKVDRRGPNECWPWKASKFRTSHGRFNYQGSIISAARVVLLLQGLPPAENLVAAHSCDRGDCCNPHHLSWATQDANVQDMLARGRHYSQTHNPKGIYE